VNISPERLQGYKTAADVEDIREMAAALTAINVNADRFAEAKASAVIFQMACDELVRRAALAR
jgi:hypothetical protein